MRFLADEHVPGSTIRALRESGHEVWAAAEEEPGAPDPALLERAVVEERVVLTFDRDFGALLFRASSVAAAAPPGVVFFRLDVFEPGFVAEVVLALVAGAGQGICGQFTVVDEERIRQRPLPPRPAA